jgi:hypothetical protein
MKVFLGMISYQPEPTYDRLLYRKSVRFNTERTMVQLHPTSPIYKCSRSPIGRGNKLKPCSCESSNLSESTTTINDGCSHDPKGVIVLCFINSAPANRVDPSPNDKSAKRRCIAVVGQMPFQSTIADKKPDRKFGMATCMIVSLQPPILYFTESSHRRKLRQARDLS